MAALLVVAVPTFAASITYTTGCISPETTISVIDFGSVGSPNTTDPGGHVTYSDATFNTGLDPNCGGSFLSVLGPAVGQTQNTTSINFDVAMSYFGFYWDSPDNYNTLLVYDGDKLIVSTPGMLKGRYTNIYAGAREQITKVEFTTTSCCFETDNHSYIATSVSDVPEPGTLSLLGAAAALGLTIARRKQAA